MDSEPTPDQVNPRPVSIFGTRAERRARFGPPVDRKALGPRLVSLGTQQRQFQGSHVKGSQLKPRLFEVEAFLELGGGQLYLKTPGDPEAYPAVNRTGGEQQVIERFQARRRGPDSGHFPAGRPDEKEALPAGTPEERAIARAVVGNRHGAVFGLPRRR